MDAEDHDHNGTALSDSARIIMRSAPMKVWELLDKDLRAKLAKAARNQDESLNQAFNRYLLLGLQAETESLNSTGDMTSKPQPLA